MEREDLSVHAHGASRFGGPNGDKLHVSHNSTGAGQRCPIDSGSAELESVPRKKLKYDAVLPTSKWSREDGISDDDDKRGGRGLGLNYLSGSDTAGGLRKADSTEVNTDQAHRSDTIVSEEQRQKLRQIEISVMQYRESLEEQGLRNVDEIERKVASHRKHLQSEDGLSFSTDDANKRRSSERTSLNRKVRLDDVHDYPRKRHRSQSRSRSPPRKPRERREREHMHNHNRDRCHGNDFGRGRIRDKCANRGRDDHYSRSRDRENKDRREGR